MGLHWSHAQESAKLEIGVIENMLYIPKIKYNLLSVSKITRELSCFIFFYPGFSLFQDLATGMLKGIGKETDGLYLLTIHASKDNNIPVVSAVTTHTTIKKNVNISLWHRRLAHPSINSLRLLFGYNIDVCKSVLSDCEVCPLVKHTR